MVDMKHHQHHPDEHRGHIHSRTGDAHPHHEHIHGDHIQRGEQPPSGQDAHRSHGRDDSTQHEGHGHSYRHGEDGHGHGDHVQTFRQKFFLTALLAIPAVGFNEMFSHLVGYQLPGAWWVWWVSPILGTFIYLWGGLPFLTGAATEFKSRKPGMMMLIALAITVAFVASWGATLRLLDHELNFWWELALLVVIMLLGHWVEMRSLARTSSALDSLAALLPDTAERREGDQTVAVPPDELKIGDVVLVRPGGTVPADGVIAQGRAAFDESMITGESQPVVRSVGDEVVAGTIATDSGVDIEVRAIGDETTLAGISRLVAQAQAGSTRASRLADRAAGWLFWFALIAAAITAVVWALLGSPDAAVVRTITVLVIACPHALGLAIPLVVSISTERAAHAGILVKNRMALETMRLVDVVVFDKTGTLTKGEPHVTDVTTTAHDLTAEEVLRLGAAAEAPSEHPLARAIVQTAEERGITLPSAKDFHSEPATGVNATVEGTQVWVGGPRMLEDHGLVPLTSGTQTSGTLTSGTQAPGIQPPGTQASEGHSWGISDQKAVTVIHVVIQRDSADAEVVGTFALADEVREDSAATVSALHDTGVEVVMLTGDSQEVADVVAADLGIDRVLAGVKPGDKAAHIEQLQAEGHTVAMVGDGVNDAPALAKADVGIAIGAGTDVAIGSADVILASSRPSAVLGAITLSRASYRKMKQNLWWAAGYNLAAVPLAAGILAPIGFILPMSVGAILMSASTLVVAANAQLLRRLDLHPSIPEHSTSVP